MHEIGVYKVETLRCHMINDISKKDKLKNHNFGLSSVEY